MNFSEREGYKKTRHNSLESMDDALKNDIWTKVYTIIDRDFISHGITGYGDSKYRENNASLLWTKLFQQSISDLPYAGNFLRETEPLYKNLKWNEVYDLIEFLLEKIEQREKISKEFNKILEENNSSYRIMNNIVQPIANKETIEIMESAYNDTFNQEIKNHLKNAQILYSNKQNPDFNNSCLESIKAVEAVCRIILTNQKILGDNVKEFKKTDKYNQHIIAILEKLNAFRNDVVAHATKPDNYLPNREDAVLIHTMCCGFINYFKNRSQDV